jgi:hypothetical protein
MSKDASYDSADLDGEAGAVSRRRWFAYPGREPVLVKTTRLPGADRGRLRRAQRGVGRRWQAGLMGIT